jgi:hypothetical protein
MSTPSERAAQRCEYVPVEGDPAIRVCVTHDPEFGLYGDELCRFDGQNGPAHEADVLAQAIRIMRKYRGGLGSTIAILQETEQAVRRIARSAEGERS